MLNTRTGWALGAAMAIFAWPAATMGEEARIAVSNVKVELKEEAFGTVKGSKYIKVTFDATPSAAPEKGSNLKTKLTCKVGEATATDEIIAGTVRLDTLQAGKAVSMPSFLFKRKARYLPGTPESCDVAVTQGGLMTKADKRTAVGSYCWDGKEVNEGACTR